MDIFMYKRQHILLALSLLATVLPQLKANPAHRQAGKYGNNGRADLAVYEQDTGNWFIKSVSGQLLAFAENWGFKGAVPAPGDFNGNGRTDLSVYNRATGQWYIRGLGAGNPLIAFGEKWGDNSMIAVPADFNGDGIDDYVVYQITTGNWFIKTTGGQLLAFGLNWGGPNMVPVPADYNGDGRADLAVYETTTGNWFIRTLGGQLLAFGENWGNKGMVPVPGDFNGDGRADLAVYETETGGWFIRTLAGKQPILFGQVWGDKTMMPVPGDFSGDGRADLAVYQRRTGAWFIRTVGGAAVTIANVWGVPERTTPSNIYTQGERARYSRPSLEQLIGKRGPNGGFVWKPKSEGDHKLVVLLPASLTDGIKAGWIADKDGNVVEGGRYVGSQHNGGREHYRFNRQGGDYGRDLFLVSRDRNNQLIHWPIPNGGARWDY